MVRKSFIFILFLVVLLVVPVVIAKNNVEYINNISKTATLFINGNVSNMTKTIPFNKNEASMIVYYNSISSNVLFGPLKISNVGIKIGNQVLKINKIIIYNDKLINGNMIRGTINLPYRIPIIIEGGQINKLIVFRVANYNPTTITNVELPVTIKTPRISPMTMSKNIGTKSFGTIFYIFSKENSEHIIANLNSPNTKMIYVNANYPANILYMYSYDKNNHYIVSIDESQTIIVNPENNIDGGLLYMVSEYKNTNLSITTSNISYTYIILSYPYSGVYNLISKPSNAKILVTLTPATTTNIQLDDTISISN